MNINEVLRVMTTSRTRWTSLRAVGREWRHHARLSDAFMRNVSSDATVFAAGSDDPSDEADDVWRLWIQQPDKVRTEFVVGTETVIVVFKGATWWGVSPSFGARTNEGDPGSSHGTGPGDPLTDPGRLASALDLTIGESTNIAGRQAVRVTGTPLQTEGLDFFDQRANEAARDDIGIGADEYDLAVDRERGIVLRSEARLDGKPFRIIEMAEVAFDETFPTDTFSLMPPPGETFKRLGPRG